MSSFKERQVTSPMSVAMAPQEQDSGSGTWSIERVVTLLTPAFGAIAGLVTAAVGKLVPGVTLPATDLTVLFGIGAVSGVAAALKWLHGRQKFVQFETDVEKNARQVEAALYRVLANQPQAKLALSDIEKVLVGHETQIITGVGNLVHAPPDADQIAEQVVKRLLPSGGASAAATAAPGAAPAQ